ncbi:hypothetical protein BDQ12DRAFT_738942, partial [Crucibulum laeve]
MSGNFSHGASEDDPRLVRTLEAYTDTVHAVAYSPDGRHVLLGFDDDTTRIWDATTGEIVMRSLINEDGVNCAAYSPDGTRIASGCPRSIRIWDPNTGELVLQIPRYSLLSLCCIVYSPDGNRIAAGDSDGHIHVWNAVDGTKLWNIEAKPLKMVLMANNIRSIIFSLDGSRVITASGDSSIRMWSAETGIEVAEPLVHDGLAALGHCLAYSPDGKYVATGCMDGVRVWYIDAMKDTLGFLRGQIPFPQQVWSISFSPDGKYLASGCDDGTVQIWDIETGISVTGKFNCYSSVNCVCYSPDGRYIVSGSRDASIRIWDAEMSLTMTREDNWFLNQSASKPPTTQKSSFNQTKADPSARDKTFIQVPPLMEKKPQSSIRDESSHFRVASHSEVIQDYDDTPNPSTLLSRGSNLRGNQTDPELEANSLVVANHGPKEIQMDAFKVEDDVSLEIQMEEDVGVKQRELVDKILTRYPGAFTVFRELLQNADDAMSTTVEIRFETDMLEGEPEEKPFELKNARVTRWIFCNNGKPFTGDDWKRLKNIADGNPDENKVGAFGVGFYILFSVTDEPRVSSNGITQRFYWDKDLMRTQQLKNTASSSKWTTFDIPLKHHSPFSKMFEFVQFITSSIAFMSYLSRVSVYFNDVRIAEVTKDIGQQFPVAIPDGLKHMSPLQLMDMCTVNTKGAMQLYLSTRRLKQKMLDVTINALVHTCIYESSTAHAEIFGREHDETDEDSNLDKLKWLSRRKSTGTEFAEQSTLTLFTAEVTVIADEMFSDELKRRIKKRPPKYLSYDLVFTSHEAHLKTLNKSETHPFPCGSVFRELLTNLYEENTARIYIGHSTSQTTGIGGHMHSTRFISTVDRESIDLENHVISEWNKEMLYIGGLLCRIVYDTELRKLHYAWSLCDSDSTGARMAELTEEAMHITRFFTFHRSMPSYNVSNELRKAFFGCSDVNEHLLVLSTNGITSAGLVRSPDPRFAAFIRNQGVLPPGFSPKMQAYLTSTIPKIIKSISLGDVLNELKTRMLSAAEMASCLSWWIEIARGSSNLSHDRIRGFTTNLLGAARVSFSEELPEPICLGRIRNFLDRRGIGACIPVDSPLPQSTLPIAISSKLNPYDMVDIYHWTELSIIDWIEYTVQIQNVSYSGRSFILECLSSCWNHLSQGDITRISTVLKQYPCIPTSHGLQLPQDVYAPHLNFVPDIPIIQETGIHVEILAEIGVQCQISLKDILQRMEINAGWNMIFDIIQYFASMQLSPEDIDALKVARIFPEAGKRDRGNPRLIGELYVPRAVLSDMELPILEWPRDWDNMGKSESFLLAIGLQQYPSLDTIMALCSSSTSSIRSVALSHLLSNIKAGIYDNEYNPNRYSHLEFIPAIGPDGPCLGRFDQVVIDPKWSSLSFLIAQDITTAKILRVPERPLASALVSVLKKNPPANIETAAKCFTLLSEIRDFTTEEMAELSTVPMVPISPDSSNLHLSYEDSIRRVPPSECFLDRNDVSFVQLGLFHFVDFGEPGNQFLRICKIKNRPTAEDLAKALIRNPQRLLELSDHNADLFISELLNIALNYHEIPDETICEMRATPFLISICSSDKFSALDRADCKLQLRRAREIVIADDLQTEKLFQDHIWACPSKEDIIEEFYAYLGSPYLSTLLDEVIESKDVGAHDSPLAQKVHNCLSERVGLFLQGRTNVAGALSTLENQEFFVQACEKIKILKTVNLPYGMKPEFKACYSSAAVKSFGDGLIRIWIIEDFSCSDGWDQYEVAVGLCRLLCDRLKVHDSLLLHTILAMDVQILQRRGFDVERVRTNKQSQEQKSEGLDRYQRSTPSRTLSQFFSSKIFKIRPGSKIVRSKNGQGEGKVMISSSHDAYSQAEEALQKCGQEKGTIIKNRERHTTDNLDDTLAGGHFCTDVCSDLRNISTMGDIKIFTTSDNAKNKIPLDDKLSSDFITVIKAIAGVFKLKKEVIHVFYDKNTPDLVGFNRKNCVYVNLRHYEVHHASSSKTSKSKFNEDKWKQVYIAWYFNIAHEIAHNIEPSHNAIHESIFSALCQSRSLYFHEQLASFVQSDQ